MGQRRKTRCSGTWPCVFCAHFKLDCVFSAAYRRGQLLPILDVDNVHLAQTQTPVERAEITPDPGRRSSYHGHERRASLADIPSAARDAVETHHAASRLNSPEPSQTDEQGHYVGPASGVSFLLRIQQKLHAQSPPGCFGNNNTSVFNFGDRPLPAGYNSSFAILPPKPLAESMVRRYFDFAATTHRFLHRPSVEAWLEELYDSNGSMLYHKESGARSRTALLFMVFAHSNNYRSRSAGGETSKNSVVESAEAR